jgi:hypothetical protein
MVGEKAAIPSPPIFEYKDMRAKSAASCNAPGCRSAKGEDDATVTPPDSGFAAIPVERSDRHGHCSQEADRYTSAR